MFQKRVSYAVIIILVLGVAAAQASEAIDAKYKEIGASSLGKPSGAEKDVKGGGRMRMYSKGAIYWSEASGTHAIFGAAYTKYKSLGAEKSTLGYPVTDGTANGGEVILQHGGINVSKSGKATVVKKPSVTFTESGATLNNGTAKMASATEAFFLPEQPTGGDTTTITCSCKKVGLRLPLGSCSVTLTGNTVTCSQGTCSGSCQITITK